MGRLLTIWFLAVLAAQSPAVADYESGILPPILVKGETPHTISLAERMAELHVAGLSIAYVHEGKIAWTRTYGATRFGGPAVTPDTLFQAASISKPVTALAVLHLAQEGKLDLDRDVNLYLKSWKVPGSQKVTLRQLLTHTAGISVHGFRGYDLGTPLPSLIQMLDGQPPANSGAIRVVAEPGANWKYSGGGYLIIRQVLEDTTGQPFAKLMQDLVLKPIGMTRSSYDQPLAAARLAEAATPYDGDGKELTEGPHVYPEMAPDGLWTTPSDLARYVIEVQNALSGKANHVISPEMTRAMLTPSLADQGLGPVVVDDLFWHEGGNSGFQCLFAGFAKGGDGAVIMANSENGAELAGEIMRTIGHDRGWPNFTSEDREAVSLDPAVAARYAGFYRLGRYSLAEADLEQGKLYLILPGEAKARIYPAAEREWFFSDQEASVTFNPAAQGIEPAMVLHRFGADSAFRRINAERAKQVQDEFAAKLKNQTPDPAAEAALRRHLAEWRSGEPDYSRMVRYLADEVKDDLAEMKEKMGRLGPIKSVAFTGVDHYGGDLYKVTFENGEMSWHILVDLRGMTEQLGFI